MTETSSDGTGIGHPWLDARSLDMARIVVARIDEDPILIHIAHDNLARWRRCRGGLSRAHLEWVEILERPWTGIREVLLAKTDEGQRLRSSSPFTGIVSEDERWDVIERHPPPPPLRPITRDDLDDDVLKRILEDPGARDLIASFDPLTRETPWKPLPSGREETGPCDSLLASAVGTPDTLTSRTR